MKSRFLKLKSGARIQVIEAGKGKDLLFLHSAGGHLPNDLLIAALATRYRVLAPLLPGYGESSGEDELRDMLDVTLHTLDVLEALKLKKPIVVGHSMGGMIAAEMAAIAHTEIEKLCLAEAIRHGDLEWEGSIVSAFHRLSRVPERDPDQPGRLHHEWTLNHESFHRNLVAGCPNQWLLRMHQLLYQQSERYRQLSAPLGGDGRDVKAEHQALVDAVLDRDVQKAQQIIADHLRKTAELLMNSPFFAGAPAP